MTFKALITTLTPVHIGNGVKYQHKVEFFTDKGKDNNDWVYIIDPDKIFELIGIDGINEWTKSIEKGVSIKEFLKNRKFETNSIIKKKCPLANPIKKDKELHEQVYSPLLGPYIPGSSLKGAIKTAILDYITDKNDKTKSLTLSDIRFEEDNNRRRVNWDYYKEADKKFFGNDANHKSTRFLKLGDAFFTNVQTRVYFTQALNAEGNADEGIWKLNGAISNLYEAIPEKAETLFQFSIDEQLLGLNIEKDASKWNKIDTSFINRELFKIVKNSTKKAVEKELKLLDSIELENAGIKLKSAYEKILDEINKLTDNEFIVRVGANSGYNFMTLRWIDKLPFFQPLNNKKYYFELRKAIQKNRRRKDYRTEETWPRTRKIVTTGIPFGFVKIKILTEEEYLNQKERMSQKKKN
jgi:CRISPR type III-A-associated RAMP protein Csm5